MIGKNPEVLSPLTIKFTEEQKTTYFPHKSPQMRKPRQLWWLTEKNGAKQSILTIALYRKQTTAWSGSCCKSSTKCISCFCLQLVQHQPNKQLLEGLASLVQSMSAIQQDSAVPEGSCCLSEVVASDVMVENMDRRLIKLEDPSYLTLLVRNSGVSCDAEWEN